VSKVEIPSHSEGRPIGIERQLLAGHVQISARMARQTPCFVGIHLRQRGEWRGGHYKNVINSRFQPVSGELYPCPTV